MKSVFADTLYWGALTHPKDQHRHRALEITKGLGNTRILTTDEVLTELLDSLAESGSFLRLVAAQAVHRIMRSKNVKVVPQSHATFLAGLRLFESRPDKGYSLVDCISIQTMRGLGIVEALTSDHHFEQEGFLCLLK